MYNRILAIRIQSVNVKCFTKPIKELTNHDTVSKCIFVSILLFVAFLKDALYYLVYGLLIKIVKLFVIVLLYCIDFYVEDVSAHVNDFEVFLFELY